nr:dynein regulatory complex protein 9 isoform X2 [Chelonoidis abingdonii]
MRRPAKPTPPVSPHLGAAHAKIMAVSSLDKRLSSYALGQPMVLLQCYCNRRTWQIKRWKYSPLWKLCRSVLCWRTVLISLLFLDILCQFPMRAGQTSAMQHASDVIAETLQEMQTSGTFQSLLQAVQREEERKSNFHTTIIREEEGRKEIKSLQKRLQDVKKEKELELQNRNEMIAYLKDQLQEMKAKTDMESRYVKKDTELQVYQTQKKCSNAESDLFNEIEKLRIKTDEEIRVHVEIENFLRQQQMKLEEKLEYWMEKYEKDMESKQQELNTLKASKANDLAALQELAKQCRLFEQAIMEDRVEKEAARRKVEQDALELKSVKKLQAWWRGTMVRHNIGPYKALKKSKEDEPKGKDKGKKEKAGAKKRK